MTGSCWASRDVSGSLPTWSAPSGTSRGPAFPTSDTTSCQAESGAPPEIPRYEEGHRQRRSGWRLPSRSRPATVAAIPSGRARRRTGSTPKAKSGRTTAGTWNGSFRSARKSVCGWRSILTTRRCRLLAASPESFATSRTSAGRWKPLTVRCTGLDFCHGCWSEMRAGEGVTDAIRYFGERGKIFYVHFRDVQGPVEDFTECYLGDGNCNPVESIRALKRVGFHGFIIPDHVPRMIRRRQLVPPWSGLDSRVHPSAHFSCGRLTSTGWQARSGSTKRRPRPEHRLRG